MKHIASSMLVVVGLTHLLPLSGVLGAASLANLYGLQFNEANLEILMRYRAVLFGLLNCKPYKLARLAAPSTLDSGSK